jgi:hypothetical protein
MMFTIGLLYITFIMLRYIPSVLRFFQLFVMKRGWICQRLFLYLLRWSCDFCSLIFNIYVLYYVYWFPYVELSLYSQNKANLIMVYDLFSVFLDLICKYFIENFCICVRHGNWSIICYYYNQFWYQYSTASIEWFNSIPSLCVLGNNLRRIGVGLKSTVNPSSPGLFFVGRNYYCFNPIAHYRSV